ncbi:MAG: hypothetical protein SGJ27_21355 [Candidatus Melainabacteria bacterium]|nr:hypothetical protein [Candidatus Melainabacteria bacterium]
MLQPFVWSSISTQLSDLLLPAIATTPGALDARLADRCIAQLDVVEEYNFKRRLAVELLGAMREYKAVPRLCVLLDEYFNVVADKTDFDARLATIPWDDLLVNICRALTDLAQPADLTITDTTRSALRKLLSYCIKEHMSKCMAPALEALVAWGEQDVLKFIGKLLSQPDDNEQIAALGALEKLADYFDPEALRKFIALEFRNPSDHDNAVTLMYHRAAIALLKAHPSLGETESIADALAEARTLGNYGTEAWHQWRIIECETVARFPELDINSISHHTRSADIKVRTAALSVFTVRGITPPAVRPVYWPLVWQTE